jgi:hypothetical protein
LPTVWLGWELDCLEALDVRRRRLLRISRMKGSPLWPRTPGESDGVIRIDNSSLWAQAHYYYINVVVKFARFFFWVFSCSECLKPCRSAYLFA